MNEVSFINKVKPLTRSALSSNNCSASSGNYAVQLLLSTIEEKKQMNAKQAFVGRK